MKKKKNLRENLFKFWSGEVLNQPLAQSFITCLICVGTKLQTSQNPTYKYINKSNRSLPVSTLMLTLKGMK